MKSYSSKWHIIITPEVLTVWLIMSQNNLSTTEKILKGGDTGVALILALGRPVPSLSWAHLPSSQSRPHPAKVPGEQPGTE